MGLYLSGSTAAQASGDSAECATEPGHWVVTNAPAAATQATASKAALANRRHICKGITISIACGATAQTPIQAVLRDGATGVGAVLWSVYLSAPVNGSASVALPGMSIVGSVNTAMTLEFTGAGVAASQQTVNLEGFDVSGV